MENWKKLKSLYTKDHLSKNLKSPQIRLGALRNIESILIVKMPEVVKNPALLNTISKNDFKSKVEKWKGSDLNSAESSVINGLYNFLPHLKLNDSEVSVELLTLETSNDSTFLSNQNSNPSNEKIKLYNEIGNIIIEILTKLGYQNIKFNTSFYLPNLYTKINKSTFANTWSEIATVYQKINGFNLKLDDVYSIHQNAKSKLQEADIFIFEPIKLIVEYDEDQHFNQFRLESLNSPFYKNWTGFDMNEYKKINQRVKNPGSKKSGFCFLKSPDPYFPPNEKEVKQDNRIRQRAFRDMMKDAYSVEQNWVPTLRIPASLVAYKAKNLNKTDLATIKNYCEKILKDALNIN